MFTFINILTEEQCAQVRSSIHDLREHWIPRGTPPHIFFTLGPASYIDASQDAHSFDAYYNKAQTYNTLLRDHFGWLHETVRIALERHLNSLVTYKEDFARPGFHIWLSHAIITKPTASIHFDLQYLKLQWSGDDQPDFSSQISFTLPIRLPVNGGGLNAWGLSYEELLGIYKRGEATSIPEVLRFKNMTYYPYTPGSLALHSGHLLHQIGPTAEVLDTDERITLQGHGLYCKDQWKLYW